jgi:hypothetical protein
MDLQKMFDLMSDSNRAVRSNYHLTLGGLIDVLDKADPEAVVSFDDGMHPGNCGSYRGYYADLAFEPVGQQVSVATFNKWCKSAAGSTFQGYKGGEFNMGLDTPLWRAPYGCTGPAIIAADVVDGAVILRTKEIEG